MMLNSIFEYCLTGSVQRVTTALGKVASNIALYLGLQHAVIYNGPWLLLQVLKTTIVINVQQLCVYIFSLLQWLISWLLHN